MSNATYYKRITGSTIQGDGYSVIEPIGTLVVANGGELRYHDGNTAGGVAVGGSGGGSGGSTANTSFSGDGIGNSAGNDITISPGWDGQFTGNSYITMPTNGNASSEALQLVNNSTGGVNIVTRNNDTWAFGSDGSLTLPQSNSGAGLLNAGVYGLQLLSNNHSWTFNTDGSLSIPGNVVFSDLSQQAFATSIGVGPLNSFAAPFPITSGVMGTDYQFFFDIGNNGFPSMQSYSPEGGNPIYNSIWSVEYGTSNSINPIVSSSGGPVAVTNTGGVGLVPATLAPGDYAVIRVQNLNTGRVYRATFLGSYNAADPGNETQYGSIIVERLL